MNTFLIGCGDFLVTGRAGFRNPPMIHVRAFVPCGIDVVVAVAVVAVRRLLAASRDGAAVYALLVRFNGMRDRDVMAREETWIAMALRTGGGKPAVRHPRIRVASGFHVVDVAMARGTIRRIQIAFFDSLPVDAFRKLFDFLGVALDALRRQEFLRPGEFVHAAVTRGACGFTENRVNARGERLGLVLVASSALDSGDFCRMRKVLDIGMAIATTENGVSTACMLRGVYRNILSLVGLHSRGVMARQTPFILLLMGTAWVCGSASGSEHPRQREEHRA